MKSGDDRRAWELYKQAAESGEQPADQLRWNAAVCAVNYAGQQQKTGNAEEAKRACEDARRLAPNYGEASFVMALTELSQKRLEVGLAGFDEAVAAWSRRLAEPGLSAAEQQFAKKRLAETREYWATELVSKGQQLALDRQTVLADESFRQAIRVAPGGPAARVAQAELGNLSNPPIGQGM